MCFSLFTGKISFFLITKGKAMYCGFMTYFPLQIPKSPSHYTVQKQSVKLTSKQAHNTPIHVPTASYYCPAPPQYPVNTKRRESLMSHSWACMPWFFIQWLGINSLIFTMNNAEAVEFPGCCSFGH